MDKSLGHKSEVKVLLLVIEVLPITPAQKLSEQTMVYPIRVQKAYEIKGVPQIPMEAKQ